MPEKFIVLSCPNCGAKLEVYDDMARFACRFCGTEAMAERRGGTVMLKSLTEAIQKVQVGTDRTAAELAIPRLRKEIAAKEHEVQAARTAVSSPYGCLGLVAVILLFAILMAVAAEAWKFAVILLTVGCMLLWNLRRSGEDERRSGQEQLDRLVPELEALRQQLAEAEKVVCY